MIFNALVLEENESKIDEELLAAQGQPANIPGYFMPEETTAEKQMRPSTTLNDIINKL